LPYEKNVYVLKVDSWMTSEQYIKYKESLRINENLIENKNYATQFKEQTTKYSIGTSGLTRDQIMSIAYQYNNYKWYCSKQNYDGSKAANPNLWRRPGYVQVIHRARSKSDVESSYGAYKCPFVSN